MSIENPGVPDMDDASTARPDNDRYNLEEEVAKNRKDRETEGGNERSGCGAEGGGTCPAGPPRFTTHPGATIKHTVAVMSGKGGVGKSSVTMLLAVALRRKGFEVGIMDADITGPSIPKGLGVTGPIQVGEKSLIPIESSTGIKIMSMNLILPEDRQAVIWRGPLISSTVGQFYQDTEWGDLDFLLIDLPPGTADVPLTVMQSIPLDDIILVTSPQELSGMIVGKAVSMAAALGASVTGLIENMSYIKCPKCDERIEPFGPGHGEEAARHMGTAFLGRLPLDSNISLLEDQGRIESYDFPAADDVIGRVAEQISTQVEGVEEALAVEPNENTRVAVVLSGGMVSAHFGQAEQVMIVDVVDGKISSRELVDAPPHDCSALPNLFREKGVTNVIAGGMGAGAVSNLDRAGITVYAGISGSPEDALGMFLAGRLPRGEAVCGGGEGHGHDGGCAHQ